MRKAYNKDEIIKSKEIKWYFYLKNKTKDVFLFYTK